MSDARDAFLYGTSEQRMRTGRRIITDAGYDMDEVLKHAFPNGPQPIKPFPDWSAAVLQDDVVMHQLSGDYTRKDDAIAAALSFVVKHSLDTATHVRASNGVENVVTNAWPV